MWMRILINNFLTSSKPSFKFIFEKPITLIMTELIF